MNAIAKECRDALSPTARALLAHIEQRSLEGFTGSMEIEFIDGGVRDLEETTHPLLPGLSRMVRRQGS